MKHRNALILLALTAAMWSVGGLLIKSIALHPLAIAGLRSAIAAVVLAIAARGFKFIWTKAQFGAAISFAVTVVLFVCATKLTTAANAILLQYTAPIYVALLSAPLLKEKVTRRDWIALAVIVVGMSVFFLEKVSTENLWGNALALTSGLSFAGIAIFLRMQKGVSTFESLFLGHVFTALIGLPFFFLGRLPSNRESFYLGLLGVFQLGIPYVLYGIAIRHVTALEATLIPVLEPILNPVWVALFLGEVPSTYALLGGGIVIAAVLWHSVGGMKKPRRGFVPPPPID